VDIWNNTFTGKRGTAEFAVGVLSHDVHRPVFLARKLQNEKGQFEESFIEIENWDTTKPNAEEFRVPAECAGKAVKKALLRNLIRK
jgi:hypothetical protein